MMTQRICRRGLVAAALALSGLTALAGVVGAQTSQVTGAAILTHEIGKLAVTSAELMAAGRVDEVMALRTRAEQADWKQASAGDRAEVAARLKARAPESKALADAIRAGGVISIDGNEAMLRATVAGVGVIATYEREGGRWRAVNGPIRIAEPEVAAETRVTGDALVGHPVAAVALRYVELVHAGRMDDAMALASSTAQAAWKADAPGERAASAAFRRRMLPSPAEMKAGMASGVLIVEGDDRATLNLIRTAPATTSGGTVTATSTTVALPFVLEGGQWRLAR